MLGKLKIKTSKKLKNILNFLAFIKIKIIRQMLIIRTFRARLTFKVIAFWLKNPKIKIKMLIVKKNRAKVPKNLALLLKIRLRLAMINAEYTMREKLGETLKHSTNSTKKSMANTDIAIYK